MEIMMEKWRGNRHSCGSFFVDNCNCELVPGDVDSFKLSELKPFCSQYLHSQGNDTTKGNELCSNSNSDVNSENYQQYKHSAKAPTKTQRELRSFSHPAINFIFTREHRSLYSSKDVDTEAEINSSIVPLYHRVSNQIQNKADFAQQMKETNAQSGDMNLQLIDLKSIDKAQQFFAESGILGPTNFSTSRDLIKKTSRIHLDLSLKSKIRKTSLCLLSRTLGEKCTPKTAFEDSNELIVREMQRQVNSLKCIIETGETKIIMLRAEVNKLKRVLQELMYANAQNKEKLVLENPNLCVFCREEPGFCYS